MRDAYRPVPGAGVVNPGTTASGVLPADREGRRPLANGLVPAGGQGVKDRPAGGRAAARRSRVLDPLPRPEETLGKRSTAQSVEPRALAAFPRLVILESPFAPASCPQGGCGGPCAPRFPGGCRLLLSYGRAAVADSLRRGEAPMASHLLYTQALDDTRPAERRLGILAGLAWGRAAAATVVYADWGVSEGMAEGVARARAEGRPVEERRLGAPWGPR
jgi:hypothetical protein